MTPLSPLLERAQRLATLLAARSSEFEAHRRLPSDLVEALHDAGLLRLSVPLAFQGAELPLSTQMRVVETLATGDAATAWCVMIANCTALACAYLEDPVVAELFADPRSVACGVFAPKGMAVPSEGGFLVSGLWAFGSGCEHSAWRLGGVCVFENNEPKMLAPGVPDLRLALMRASETQVIDTWKVSGLCGTGSHDLAAEKVFVPTHRMISPLRDPVLREGGLYRLPLFCFLAAQVATVAVGIARAAIDSFKELAVCKVPMGTQKPLAQRSLVQSQVAEAEALYRSARAFLFESVAQLEAETGSPSLEQRSLCRLAATHAARSCARAVDLMYEAGGGSAIYSENPLQRHFRDVHVVTQHIMVSGGFLETAGKQLLGQEVPLGQL